MPGRSTRSSLIDSAGGIPLVTIDETIDAPRRPFVHVFVLVENVSSRHPLGASFRVAVGQWWCADPTIQSTRVTGDPFCAVGVTWERTGVLVVEAFKLRDTWSGLRRYLTEALDDLVDDCRATH